jgi:hypothetical protein
MAITSIYNPSIVEYVPGVSLVVEFDTGDDLFENSDQINCSLSITGVGGAAVNATNNPRIYTKNSTITFTFNISGISSNAWDFIVTDITLTPTQSISLFNIHNPFVTPLIMTYNPESSLSFTCFYNDSDSHYPPGSEMTCHATPLSGGSVIIANGTGAVFPASDGTISFNFTLGAGVASDTWNFDIINIANPKTFSFNDIPVPICFLAGTLIRTPDGDVPVECLKEGDFIVAAGTLKNRSELVAYESPCDKKIKRIVNFKVTGDLPEISRPVKFKAGSLGNNLPEQDLCVSPWHGILIDGRLKNANLLFNGDEINFDFDCVSAHYYHIELEEHSVIFANGVKTESFYDQVKDRLTTVVSTPELANA